MAAKDAESSEQEPGREIARRLIESRRSAHAGTDANARAASDACADLYYELSRWLGPEGCHALFNRALIQAGTHHQALEQIQLRAQSDRYVEGIAEAIMAHGDAATSSALESLLTNLVVLLGRLIGEDMAMRLIEPSLRPGDSGTSDSRKREEA